MVLCPDCVLSTAQHTLKCIHKKREYCKGALQDEVKEVKEETTAEVNCKRAT